MAGEAAFVEDEAVDREGFRGEGPVALEEGLRGLGIAAVPAGERDVRVERPALGLEAGCDASALDLGGERGERGLGLDAGP